MAHKGPADIYTSGTCAQAHTPMPRKEEEKVEEEEVEEEVEVGGWRRFLEE